MIVLVGGEKGGVGKTTLAVNLAAMRARAGHDVLLVDADKQASANLWASIRDQEKVAPPVRCVQKRGKGLAADVRDLATRYEDIVIDAGGQDSVELRAAMTIAALAIFPIQPSLFDAATLETLAELVALGRVRSDSFAGLRALLTPSDRRKPLSDGKRIFPCESDSPCMIWLLAVRAGVKSCSMM